MGIEVTNNNKEEDEMEKITRTAKIQSLGTLDGMGPHVVLEIDLPGDDLRGALVTGIPLSEEEVVALANGPGLYGTVRVTIDNDCDEGRSL